jgi:predicted amidohydrolase YtcJ
MASGGMKPHAALRAATIDSADAIGFAKDLGSLEVGKLADLVILDKDVMTIDPKDILAARVRFTIIGGEVVYEKP